MYMLYAFKCGILHYTVSLNVALGANRIMNMNNFKSCFHFAYYMPSLSQTLFTFLTLIS